VPSLQTLRSIPSSCDAHYPHLKTTICFFSRDDQYLRIETRYDNEASDYVLVVHWPDGRTQTERFSIEPQFRSRVVEFQKYIENEGWGPPGSPKIIPDGWRIA